MSFGSSKIHHRESTRLRSYDYSANGMYFVTICTEGREYLLGNITDGKMLLNAFGRFADTALQWIPKQYPYVTLDTYVIMPNHLHAIFCISDGGGSQGGSRTAPTTQSGKPLGRLVGVFKTVSTKWINVMRNTPAQSLWQRNYHDRIIRNENELNRIRAYIQENPSKWSAKMGVPFANGT